MSTTHKLPSISVVICCYNSASRLTETLQHLQAQQVSPDLVWELIVIDNASTDDTAGVANEVWAANPVAPLRVVPEPTPGLSHARAKGAAEARHDIIALVDDDNWTPPNWLNTVAAIFRGEPYVGVVGGPTVEVCEVEPPEWFHTFKGNYAVYALNSQGGVVEQAVCGAGLCFRREAWEVLLAEGYSGILTDRKGKELSSGGDFETCAALHLAGWKIWYDPDLLIEHFIPAGRLDWDYLCRLNSGFGKQSIYLDAYHAVLPKFGQGEPASDSWIKEALKSLKALLGLVPQVCFRSAAKLEGNAAWLIWLNQRARLKALWHEKGNYRRLRERIAHAPWNHLRNTD